MKHFRIATITAAGILLASCGASSTPTTTTANDVLKTAAVFYGSTEDNSWSNVNNMAISAQASDVVTISKSESITDDSNAELTLEQLAAAGNKVVFATWPGYADAVQKVAPKYPNTCFQLAGAALATQMPNVGTYTANFNEGRYLSGMAAGAATKSGKIGFVASFPSADAVGEINAFTLGVRMMNPEAIVQVTWTATKFDELMEQQAAESLIRAGADVIAQSTFSNGPGTAAENNGAKWIGNNVNQAAMAPNGWLTAPTWMFGTYVGSVVSSVARGSCPTDHYVATLANKAVELAEFGPSVSEAIRAEIVKAVPDLTSIQGKTDFIDGVVGSAQG
jgi:basic membrane protein A